MHEPTHISLYLSSTEFHPGDCIDSKNKYQFGSIVTILTIKNANNSSRPFMTYNFEFFLFNVYNTQRILTNGVEPSDVNRNNAINGNTPTF